MTKFKLISSATVDTFEERLGRFVGSLGADDNIVDIKFSTRRDGGARRVQRARPLQTDRKLGRLMPPAKEVPVRETRHPKGEARAKQSPMASSAMSSSTPSSPTLVLAVDDDPTNLKLIEMSLTGAGYTVLTFDRARSALAEMHEGLRPDVIVSDVSMPLMDGFNFYGKVREIQELRAVPFLFLTAMGEREYIRYGMSIGADDYVTKPFQRDELVQAVSVRLQRVAELRRPLEGAVKVEGFGNPLVERDGETAQLGLAQGLRATLLPAREPLRREHL